MQSIKALRRSVVVLLLVCVWSVKGASRKYCAVSMLAIGTTVLLTTLVIN